MGQELGTRSSGLQHLEFSWFTFFSQPRCSVKSLLKWLVSGILTRTKDEEGLPHAS